MIRIANNIIDPDVLMKQYSPGSIERNIISILSASDETYDYDSEYQLKFELKLRKNTVAASYGLYRSRMSFRTFRNSVCNTVYWERTNEGGFLLRPDVKPSNAIKDIFDNGWMYGTECATAIVIVFYKAVLDVFPEALFNELFPEIYLMDWQYLDNDLGIRYYTNPADYLPGDCRYFKNPDVNPLTPQWQGENAIDLSGGIFYGHGIGIQKPEGIIEALNEHRKSGSEISAYLQDSATYPDFRYLASASTRLPDAHSQVSS